jgi:hypothetical protein
VHPFHAVTRCFPRAYQQRIARRRPALREWYARLDSPGGPLPFGLELTQHLEHGGWQGIILNPPERIAIDVEVDSDLLAARVWNTSSLVILTACCNNAAVFCT